MYTDSEFALSGGLSKPSSKASLLCLSECTRYRRLNELDGLAPATWLRELRLAQARLLLQAEEFGLVTQVAEALGFANSRYFATLDAGAVRSTHQCIFTLPFSAASASP